MEFKNKEHLFLYNSKKIEDRQSLGYLRSKKDIVLNERDVSKDMLTERQILEVRDHLDIPLEALYDTDIQDQKNYSEEELLKLMANNPTNFNTPIILSKKHSYMVDSSLNLIKK